MNLPLPQALDFLHSQLLSSMCISPPARKDNNPPAPFASPPLKQHFQWPEGTAEPPPNPPSFHVWITRKVAPHMAVIDLRCDAVPWACFRRGAAVLPPISLPLSFFVPVSAFPGLFKHLVSVPFYRLPKTLGWPYSDAPLNGALTPHPPLARLDLSPLLSLLRVLPFFTPPSVRNKVANHLQGDSGCHYTLDAIVYILEEGMRPGTKKQDGDIEKTYDWPLNWELPDLTSDLCKGLSTCHPEIFQLLTSLGRRFISKFLIALLAADGHFLTPSPLYSVGPSRRLHHPLPPGHLWLWQNLLCLHDACSSHIHLGHSNSPYGRAEPPALYRRRYHLRPPRRCS